MSSKDFYLKPLTLSGMFKDAIRRAGYGEVQGWRSAQGLVQPAGRSPQGVEVVTEGGRMLYVSVGAGNQVVVDDVTEALSAKLKA
jgi:hypothetical protein